MVVAISECAFHLNVLLEAFVEDISELLECTIIVRSAYCLEDF